MDGCLSTRLIVMETNYKGEHFNSNQSQMKVIHDLQL